MPSDLDDVLKQLKRSLDYDLKSGNKEVIDLYSSITSKSDLKSAATKLKSNLKKWMNYYFSNYDAVSKNGFDGTFGDVSYHYDGRSGDLLDSIEIEVNTTDDKLSARIYFDDAKTRAESLWGWSGDANFNTVSLINDGWQVRRGWHKEVHHFGYFEGARFIEAAIMDARKDPMFEGVDIVYDSGGYAFDL